MRSANEIRLQTNGSCRVCGGSIELLLDFGPRPLCNRLLKNAAEQERVHPLRMGQCLTCDLLQLIEPIAAAELKPERPLRYTEPESHLDQVADLISTLPGMDATAAICGISSKDQSTVDRLRARGFHDARCLHPAQDLAIHDPTAGVETIQQQIRHGVLESRHDLLGRYRIVIARHILEHVHGMDRFVAALKRLLVPRGYLVFEVPDFTTSLLHGDYSTLWEEHLVYFTRATFTHALESFELSLEHLRAYPYTPEESLVAVTSVARRSASWKNDAERRATLNREYAEQFLAIRQRWHTRLTDEQSSGRKIALLGAGHLGIMFVNLMNLANVIDVVVDDDPEKIGRLLPGSRQRIYDIAALEDPAIELCLLSVSPEGEERVLQRHRKFVDRGGRFRSIFAGSQLAYFPASQEIPRDAIHTGRRDD